MLTLAPIMRKKEAIRMFGASAADLARALGISPQAVYQWPEMLTLEQSDRVNGAALRLGKLVEKAERAPVRRVSI